MKTLSAKLLTAMTCLIVEKPVVTAFQKLYGENVSPSSGSVYNWISLLLKDIGNGANEIEIDLLLNASYEVFGRSDTVHTTTIQAWLDFYSN
ncbi:MAG: hypothetical protein ACXAB7_23195 [Candidatus Kariarchaeaceae archaeon]|jgi:hypothetical protein